MGKHDTTYTEKVGLPPGSIVYIGEEKKRRATLTKMNFSPDHFEESNLKKISDINSWYNPDTVTLLSDFGIHNTDIVEEAGKHFGLDQIVLEDIVDTESRVKLQEFDDYLFLPMKVLAVDSKTDEILIEHISLILARNGIISFQETDLEIFNPLKDRIRQGKGLIRQRKSDYIFYRLIDIIVDNYFIVTEYLADRLEEIEEKVLQNPNEDVHEEIYDLKKKIGIVKRTINPHRESISNIIKSDSDIISETTQNYLRDVYGHILILLDTIELQRETITDVLNLYMSAMNNKMNEVMKVLTVFASIFIPLTFLAGIYGMNFDIMPELHWEYGYLFAWGVMLAVVVALLIYFKRKKWF